MLPSVLRFVVRERLVVLLLAGGLIAAGYHSTRVVPVDAIPNVGENQVIVFADWPGRSPRDVEDQVTYPLSVALLSVPGAESVRGKSMFGFSFVQVTFTDDTEFYWARTRVLERLGGVASLLPDGVTPMLGPDATALGQILYYTLQPPDAGMDLAELRSLQDYVVKLELQAIDGVSEVASIGGFVRQYQIEVDPDRLRFHETPLAELVDAVRDSNIDVGAKTVESGGMEFVIRGRGFLGSGSPAETVPDIEDTVVMSRSGVPVRVRDLGNVQMGPEFRRGALDLNGAEAVGGIIVMRFGENPRHVIDAVKERMASLEPSLGGVTFRVVYDRTQLINETIATLTEALQAEIIITVVVVLLFLLHIRASIVVAVTLPIAVLMTFVAMRVFGIDANIMSLAGIAISIGEIIDLSIIVSENIYRHLADWEAEGAPGGQRRRQAIIVEATHEVAPAVMTAISTTIVSFLPVFFLVGRDYRLFAPLAYTKSFAMVAALIVAVLLVPMLARLLLRSKPISRFTSLVVGSGLAVIFAALAGVVWFEAIGHWIALSRVWLTLLAGLVGFAVGYMLGRERLRPIEENPVSQLIHWIYEPLLRLLLVHKLSFLTVPAAVVLLGIGAWIGLPTILRPLERSVAYLGTDLNELPGYVEAKHLFTGLETDDWIALDEGTWFYMPVLYPGASLSQALEVLQTQGALIKQIPEVADVLGKIGRAESALDPAPAAMIETYVMLLPKGQWRPGTTERMIWDEINNVATLPGVTRASPLQPIEGRVVMLQSGIRASMAIRIYGDDLSQLAQVSLAVRDHLRRLPQVHAETVNPDIVLGKPYVEFEINREAAARFGMSVTSVNEIVEVALGGLNVTRTVHGRERYPIQVRYQRDLRDEIEQLERIPVVTPKGETVPLGQLTHMTTTWGPDEISSENARLVAYVMFSPSGSMGSLETATSVQQSLREAMLLPHGEHGRLDLPDGYFIEPVGSFREQLASNRRLMLIIPVVILINFLLIYFQFRRLSIALIIFAAIPVAFGGGMILVALAGVKMNTAIWVGFIAVFGLAVDDGLVMATYLDQVFRRRRFDSISQIRDAVVDAGLKRIRPCLMTSFTTFAALTPVLLATGRGADVAKAMALPVFGGTLFVLITLFVVPVLFSLLMESKMRMNMHDDYWAGEEHIENADN
ncbi:MAG: efflux RND transporter permease subunit [Pirellulaceae bacterium]|nr:efflux RND transporter permease subunit [Pirellulaceae bacterium]